MEGRKSCAKCIDLAITINDTSMDRPDGEPLQKESTEFKNEVHHLER
jgi:hypothetical protein